MSRALRLLILAAGIGLFVWLIARVGVQALLADGAKMGWMLVPILALWGFVYAAYAAAWWITLDGTPGRPPFAALYRHSITGFALNYLTPVLAWGGEPYKAAAVSEAVGGKRAAGSVLAFNLVHTLSHLALWLLAALVAAILLPRTALGGPGTIRAGALVIGVVVASLATLVIAVWRRGFLLPAWGLLERIPPIRALAASFGVGSGSVEGVDEAAAAFARERPARLALAVLVDLLGRAVATLEFWLVFVSVGAPEPLWMTFLVGGLSTLLLNLLFFFPFEVGAREGGLFLLFRFLGLDPTLAVFTVIVIRLREVVWIGTGLGLLALPGGRRPVTAPAPSA